MILFASFFLFFNAFGLYVHFFLFFNCTCADHMQDCCLSTYMARWFATSITPPPISGISPHVLSPQPLLTHPSPPQNRPQCVMLPSLWPCVLIVQYSPMSENMQHLIFCSCVSLLRMMDSSFIHVPTKETNSSFLWLHSIPWCVCATFSLSSISLMGIWVGSRSLLL